jgi:hypothetical protein
LGGFVQRQARFELHAELSKQSPGDWKQGGWQVWEWARPNTDKKSSMRDTALEGLSFFEIGGPSPPGFLSQADALLLRDSGKKRTGSY